MTETLGFNKYATGGCDIGGVREFFCALGIQSAWIDHSLSFQELHVERPAQRIQQFASATFT